MPMCQFCLKLPGGELLRKRTRLRGTLEVVNQCRQRCQGKWMNVSEFAGGYTEDFAKAAVRGAEKYLKQAEDKPSRHGVCRRRQQRSKPGSWPRLRRWWRSRQCQRREEDCRRIRLRLAKKRRKKSRKRRKALRRKKSKKWSCRWKLKR